MQYYLSDLQLAERYGVARPTIWRWASQGLLPTPVSLSPGCTRWLKDEIEAIDAERQRTRRAKPVKEAQPASPPEDSPRAPDAQRPRRTPSTKATNTRRRGQVA